MDRVCCDSGTQTSAMIQVISLNVLLITDILLIIVGLESGSTLSQTTGLQVNSH